MQSSPITPAVQCQNVGAKMNLSFKSPHVHPPQSSLFFALLSLYLSRALAGSHWPNFRVTRCVCVWVCVWMWVWVWLCVCAWLFSINSTSESHICSQFVLCSCGVPMSCWKIGQTSPFAVLMSYLISSTQFLTVSVSLPPCATKRPPDMSLLILTMTVCLFLPSWTNILSCFPVMLQSLQSHEYLYYIQARVHTMW